MSDTEVRLILLPVGEDSISVEFAVNSSEIEAEAAIVEAAIVEPAIVEPAIAEHLTQEDELLISSLCRELVEDVCENEVELCISTLPGDIGAVEVSITPLVDLLLDHASEKADSRKLYTKSEFMLIGEDKALKAFPPALDLSYPGFREFDLRVTPMERAATSDILRFLGLPDDDDPIQSLKPMWATNNRAGFAPGARQPAQQPSKQLGGLPTRPPPGFPPQQNGPIRSRLIEDGNMPETNTPRDRRFGAPKLTDMAKGARGGAWAASSPPDKDGGGGFLGRSPPDRLRDRDGQARVAAGPPVEHEMVQRGGDRVDARGSMDRGHGDRWGNDPKKPGDNWRQAIQDDRNREDRGGDRGDRGDRAPVKERWSVQRDKDAVEEVGGNDGGRRAWEMGRQDNARHDNARQDNARQDNARQDRDIANGHGMRVDAHRDDGGDKRQGGQGGQGGRRDAPQRMTAAEMETERLKMREEMAAAKAKQPVNSTTNIFGHEELNLDDLIDHEFEAKPAHQRQTGPPPGMIPPVQGVKMSFQALAQAAASGHPGAMGHAPLSKPTVAGQGGDKVLSLEELEKHIAAPKPRGGAPPGMGAPPSPAGKKQANNNASQALLGMLKKAQVQGGLQQGPQQQQLLPQQGYHAMPPQPPMPASVLSLFKQIDEGMQLPGGGGGGAQPNAAPGFGGAQPNASQGFGGAQPNGTHGFGGAHPNGTQGFGGAQPNASPGFGGAQPNTAPGFGGAQPYGTQGFGGAQPNTAPGFGGDQPNTAPGFGGAQPNGTQGFGGAQPNTAPGFGGAQPNATQGFGGGQSNAPSPAPGGGAAGPAKSTIPKDILAAFGGGGGGTNNGAANKGAASGLSSLMSIWSAGPLPPPPLQKEGGSGGGAATTAAATTSGAHQSMGSFGSVAQLWNSQTHSGGGGDMGGGGGGGAEGGGAGGGGAGGSLADLFARATTLQPTSTAQYGQGQAPHMPPPHTQGQGQAQGTPADALQNLLRGLAASQAGGGHHMGGTSGHMPQSQAHPQHMHHQQQQHHNPQQQQQAQLLQHLLANAQQQQQQQQSLAAPGAQQTQQRMQLLMMQHQMQQQQLQQQQQAALQAMLTGAGHNAGGQGGGMGQNQNAQLLFLAQQRMQQQQMQQQQQQQNAQLLAQMAGGGGAQQQQQQQGGMGMPGGGGGAKGTDPSNLMRFFESQSNYNLGQAPPMSQAKARPGGGALPTARNVAELEQILGQRR